MLFLTFNWIDSDVLLYGDIVRFHRQRNSEPVVQQESIIDNNESERR